VSLRLAIDAGAVCIPWGKVMQDFESTGEWRFMRASHGFDQFFFAVRPGSQEAGEMWFRFKDPGPDIRRPSICVIEVTVVQECQGRCGGEVWKQGNAAAFGLAPVPPYVSMRELAPSR
jgi:hypothetical protein